MKPIRISIVLLVLSIILFTGCASEALPGGGPPDTTPPALIGMNVPSGSIGVPNDQEIVFYFSENLNPDNIEKQITVFPISGERVKIRQRGRNLSIAPNGEWDTSVVYTIIAGKGISDIRGNNIVQPVQLSFTSGATIPKNMILGKVQELDRETSATIAISRKSANPDSIIMFPEYYTQTDPDGQFVFEYLPADTFHIAGYVDMDKSNSYKDKFDGVCIPENPNVLPDTSSKVLLMEALYDNFLTGRIIKAEHLDPSLTEITFSKDPDSQNGPENILVDAMPVDSVIFDNNVCRVYHRETQKDTVELAIKDLVDKVGVIFADSVFFLPTIQWPDSFFHFEQIGQSIRITPDPLAAELNAVFQSNDTSAIVLKRLTAGFYALPRSKSQQQGTCLPDMPFLNERTVSDSGYAFNLRIAALPEYGSVMGSLVADRLATLMLVLHNDKTSYEIAMREPAFAFKNVEPGTYALSYYIDANANFRRDRGRPYPHEKPEFLHLLDERVDVRARWDTKLAEPYKIVVDNGK